MYFLKILIVYPGLKNLGTTFYDESGAVAGFTFTLGEGQ